jgi:hypothetical protein
MRTKIEGIGGCAQWILSRSHGEARERDNEVGLARKRRKRVKLRLVKTESGHAAKLPVIGGSNLAAGGSPTLVACGTSDVTTELRLDGTYCSEPPRMLALSNLGSRADRNNRMAVNRIGGNLAATGAETLG